MNVTQNSPDAHEHTIEILEEAERTGKVDVRFERFAFASARPGEGMVAHTNVEITCKDGASAWERLPWRRRKDVRRYSICSRSSRRKCRVTPTTSPMFPPRSVSRLPGASSASMW